MSVPFIPVGIDHIVIWVSNLTEAQKWYEEVLGCRFGFEYPEIAMVHLWYGPVLIGLWDENDPKANYAASQVQKGQNVHHIAFAWQGTSAQNMRQHLADHNIEIIRDMHQIGARGYGLALYIKDPWDNLIELKGPPEHVC